MKTFFNRSLLFSIVCSVLLCFGTAAKATDVHVTGSFAPGDWFGQTAYVAERPASFAYDVAYVRNAGDDGIASLTSATITIGGTVYQTGAIEFSPSLPNPVIGLIGGGNGPASLGTGAPDFVLAWSTHGGDALLWYALPQYEQDHVVRAFARTETFTESGSVPLPGSMALIGIGAAGLAWRRRRE